mmetsp:Transcript_43692/g.103129  ORF Transcript_43692/g.103129 Transcript_43692/m.103129 type:complete len:321 (+) Transcript_43692:175-1137(+)
MPKADVSSLVTQAPDSDDGNQKWGVPAKPPPDLAKKAEVSSITEPPPGNSAGRSFCRCLWPSKCPAPQKLDAVVPMPEAKKSSPEGKAAPQAGTEEASPLSRPKPRIQEERQLPPQVGQHVGRKTLVLDLDETLVHSSFRLVSNADIVIVVELEGDHHHVFVRKRPGVDTFLLKVAELYEVVVYTASMAKYANPLLDKLDSHGVIAHRLFREACTRYPNGYVKDLSRLGRSLSDVIIIDNSPMCYALQPANAIPIKTWRDDMSDRELWDLIPILHSLAEVENIPAVLAQIIWAEVEPPDEEEQMLLALQSKGGGQARTLR